MSRPEIVMQTPAAKKLEAEVQRKLAEYSYSTADDVVMAEYVVVMLANAKTPDQITAELSELIGEDMYDPGFTTWLFEEVARQYGIPSASSTSISLETQEKLFQPIHSENLSLHHDIGDKIQTVNDSRDHQVNYRGSSKRSGHPANSNRSMNNSNRINPGGVFGQAVTGLKRSGPNDILKDSPPHRRLRQDDYPSGPIPTGPRSTDRNFRDPHWSNPAMPDRREHINGQRPPSNHFPFGRPMGAESAAKSILERVGVAVNPNQQFRNNDGFPGGYDNQTPPPFRRPKDHGINGAPHPLAPSQQPMFYGSTPYPIPLMPPHPFAQQHFNSPNPPTPQLFLANGQPYIPPHPFPIPGSTPQAMYPYPVMQPPVSQSQRLSGSQATSTSESKPKADLVNRSVPIVKPVEPEMDPLPSVPLLREECKYNLACKNAWCPSSHCAPKGHPKTSMLLSFYPCELQLKCTDPECLKAHVSPQQADPKSSIKVMKTNAPNPTTSSSQDTSSNRPATIVTSINNKPIPCRFGSQCTRSGCVFSHPWIVNDRMSNLSGSISTDKEFNFSSIPCKFGLQCARPDCFYQHPNTRGLPSKNISKTFNNSNIGNGGLVTGQTEAISASTIAGGTLAVLSGTEKLSPSKKFTPAHAAGTMNANADARLDGNEVNGGDDDHLVKNDSSNQNVVDGDSKVNDNSISNSESIETLPTDIKNLSNTGNNNNNGVPSSTTTNFQSASAPIPAGV